MILTATNLGLICLTSFVLKTLKKFLQIHFKPLPVSISSAQNAYSTGRYTETVLSALLGNVEKDLAHKLCSMATFIDVEGACNNVHTEYDAEVHPIVQK